MSTTTSIPRPSATTADHAAGPGMPRRVSHVRDLIFYVVLIAVCAVPLWPLYRHPSVVVVVAVSVLCGLAVGALSGVRAVPWHLATVIAIGVGLLAGVPSAVPTLAFAGWEHVPAAIGRFVNGLVYAWGDIVSVDPPLGDYDTVLVPVFVVVYVGAILAMKGFLAGRRWVGLLTASALLVFGIVFGAASGLRPIEVGIAALSVALVWAVVVRAGRGAGDGRSHRGGARRGVAAVVFALLCAVVGGLVTHLVQPERREVLRLAFAPTYLPQRHVSPLQEYRSWVTGDSATATVATVEGLPRGSMLRVAVMDDYNGVSMEVGTGGASGSFARVPYEVNRDGQEKTTVKVHLAVPPGQWLPVGGGLEAVDLPEQLRDRFYYNKELDSAVLAGGAPAGMEYSVDAVALVPALRSGVDSLDPASPEQRDVPTVPQTLIDTVRARWIKAATPGERLQIALSFLQAGYVSHSGSGEVFSRSGHSVQRLDLLAQDEPMVGDAEQYAVAFDLLARELGFPSRVVAGFVDADGDGTLKGAELTAWVEVKDAQRGWVSIDPNPRPREADKDEASTQNSIALPRSVLPPEVSAPQDGPVAHSNETPQAPRASQSELARVLGAIWWWTWRIGLSLALLSSPLWLVLVLEAWRRAVRRRTDRRRLSVAGGWAEARDAAIDAGFVQAAAQTRQEFARSTGNSTMTALATRADELSFSPVPASAQDVSGFWREVGRVHRSLLRGRPLRDRLRARFSWRSLTRRRRRDPHSRGPGGPARPLG